MATVSSNKFPSITLEEVASDGSATTNPVADHRKLFLGEDGLLHLRDSAGTITDVGSGGGGGLALSVLGYNTVGASDETITNGRQYMKKITTSAAGLIASVDLYLDATTTDPTAIVAYALTDNAGLPELVMGQSYTGPIGLVGSNGHRWFTMPLGVPVPSAGDYWIAFVATTTASAGLRIKYDAGSDRITTIGPFSLDANYGATTDSTRQYSFRANFLS